MKINKLNTFFIALVGLFAVSCSGNIDTSTYEPVLSVDKTQIDADGTDKALFTVMVSGVDKTKEAEIVCISDKNLVVSNGAFSTTVAGKHQFQAKYEGLSSPTVTVEALAVEKPSIDSQFQRKVFLMEFTGQWCGMCPTGFNNLYRIYSKKYKDKAYIMAVHGGGEDQFVLPETDKMFDAFTAAYPSCVIDFKATAPLTEDPKQILVNTINSSLETGCHCGVAVASKFDEASKTATVTVKIMSELTSNYRLSVWVVEDDIVAKQNMSGTYEEKYHHSHVARKLVSNQWRGDKIGQIEAGKEAVKTYTVTADKEWNLDNTSIYAVVVEDTSDDSKNFVNNMEVCPFKNGDTPYAYKK